MKIHELVSRHWVIYLVSIALVLSDAHVPAIQYFWTACYIGFWELAFRAWHWLCANGKKFPYRVVKRDR